jgi:hypothetical protein
MSTTHQLFVVQQVIDSTMGVIPLHFPFQYMSNALIGCAAQAVPDTAQFAVKIDDRQGDVFDSTSGVPQDVQ